MGTNKGTKFRVKVDSIIQEAWSIGLCLSHWYDETYLYINLLKWSISIGFLYSEVENGNDD
jgi:hypothetical protein